MSASGSFVGRVVELEGLRERFASAAWVTLLGPGGMGKTRLATRFADGARGQGLDVCFVELASLRELAPALVRIARALGIARVDADLSEIARAIASRLARGGRRLLVLDDVEGIAPELAPFVARWASHENARLLVTSRRVLGGEAEQVVSLEPLDVEDAVALFVARARSVRPSVRIDDAVARAIVEAIDRMPLAIELAASRLRVLSVAELVRRLHHPLAILGSAGEGRHASIRRAVLDSLELLQPVERRVFALAATLHDGFSLDDAEVALGEVVARGAVLDALDALVRTSLIRVRVDDEERARYAYFATIREVASELEEPGRAAVSLGIARHFARAAAPPLEVELDNVVLAHRVSVENALTASSAEHAEDALATFLRIEGALSAWGRSALRESLADATERALEAVDAPPVAHARVRLGRGQARKELGRSAAARVDFEAALALAGGDETLRAAAQVRLAALDDIAGDTTSARERLASALRGLEGSSDREARRIESEALLHLGHAWRREGRLDEAREVLLRAVERHRARADDVGLAASLYELAVVEIFARRTEADEVVDEGLAVARRAGDRRMEGTLAMARGCLLHERGELADARRHHAEAAQLFADLGDRLREASALFYLATTFVESRRLDDALGILARARIHAAEVGAPRYEALVAACSASTLALAGRAEEARAAIEEAERRAARVAREPALEATVAVHTRVVDVLAETPRSDERIARAIEASERDVAAASNDDSRFALRLLRSVASGVEPLDAALEIGPDGAWFRPSGATDRVRLPERSPLRRLLWSLAARRVEAPGEVVSIDELLAAGWPGEKMRIEAGLNRVYVAVATLRKRGLSDAVVRAGGGYLLSPALAVDVR